MGPGTDPTTTRTGSMLDARDSTVRGRTEAWVAGARTVWLPTAAEMGALDREAVASGATTERTLIEAAGREVARRIQHHWPEGRVVAVAGRGHNGADALVALRTLHAWGRDVAAVLASDTPPDPDVLIGWDLPLLPREDLVSACAGAAVVLDGILGTGVKGAPREPQASLIEGLNALDAPVAAVDGPSGADFSSGAVAGSCVRARLTVCLGWPNLGLLRYPARDFCGRIEAVEIGFPPPSSEMGARAITGRWVAETLVPREGDAHKGRAGYLTLIAGQSGMAGAAVLAARAALRGGVGILKVVGDPANREILQRACPGAIFVPWDDRNLLESALNALNESVVDVNVIPDLDQYRLLNQGIVEWGGLPWDDRKECVAAVEWAGALAVGPGLGRSEERLDLVERTLAVRDSRPVALDADGLTLFEGRPAHLAELLLPRDVVTPHPGELARLTGATVSEVLADPSEAARSASEMLGCVVLLKGAPSVISETGQPLRVSTTGGPEVASGGTGDVVTGLTGAYLAAGMSAADAGAAALFLIGVAAARSDEPAGHLAADIPDRLPAVRKELAGLPGSTGPLIFVSGVPGA